MHSYWNIPGEARFQPFFPSLTFFFFPFSSFLYYTQSKHTLRSASCPDTASCAGFNSDLCFQSSTRWSVKDFQPCLQADSRRGQQLVRGAMRFLPRGSDREANGGNRCGKSAPPLHPACRSKAAKKQIWALFRCGGNNCLVLLMEKGCWSW